MVSYYNSQRWDVIVIGVGPSGSRIAELIAKAGFRCLIIEQDIYPGFRKASVACIPLNLCNRLGIKNDIIEKEIYSHIFHFPHRIRKWAVKKPISVTVDRQKFETFLVENAIKSGVAILSRIKVIDVKKGPIIFAKNLENGEEFSLRTDLVVFANGTDDLAYKTLGIGVKNEPNNTIMILAYEFECRDNLLNSVKINFDLQNDHLVLYRVYPKRDTLTVLVGMLYSEKIPTIKFHLNDFIKEASLNLLDKKILKITAGMKPIYLAENLFTDSALVIGDAAGMVNPLSEDGIGYGIQSAEIAAKICIKALEGKKYDKSVLSQYVRELSKTRWWWWLKIWGRARKIILGLTTSRNSQRILHLQLVRFYLFVAKILLKMGINNS